MSDALPNILIVDDEAPIREMVEFTLSAGGFRCVGAASISEARAAIADSTPDLILLDWMLPGGESGLDLARSLCAGSGRFPIIMLTARTDNADKVTALEAGADDFICKPFSPSELKARIRAVLRRSGQGRPAAEGDVFEAGGLRLNESTRRVTANGAAVDLGPTEFRLLNFLMRHPERVFSRADLIGFVWPPNIHVEERTVDVHIRNLRRALAPSGMRDLIQTVRSAGYRFSAH